MRIWYQGYVPTGFDSAWETAEKYTVRYAQKVARPDTTVDIHGVEKLAARMVDSEYIQYLHVSQVVEKVLQAEQEGYDAVCIGGTLDLGHVLLREILDIPIVFIAESSFHAACLLARKFGIVSTQEGILRRQMELVKYHGLEQRCVPGIHLGATMVEIGELLGNDPKRFINMFHEASRKLISAGAGAIVPGQGFVGAFFGEQGVHDVDGIPIVDTMAILIKTAEMLVDLQKLGMKRSRAGQYAYASKEELLAARKLYGVGYK
jgi:allantoin racemase